MAGSHRSRVVGTAAARRVVVSGVGIVSAAGIGIGPTWDCLRTAPPVAAWIQGPPPTTDVGFRAYAAPEYDLAELGVRPQCLRWLEEAELREARDLRHLVAATALALSDAGLPSYCGDLEPGVAIVAANESPGFEELSQSLFRLGEDGLLPRDPLQRFSLLVERFFQLNTFLPPFYLSRAFGFAGPALFVNSACASGLNAIDLAAQNIRLGRSRISIAAAADNPLSVAKFLWFRDLGLYASDGVIRPYDARQTGTVFGDGAAALVLEDRESALARGAHVYAEHAGAGFAQDGWKITVPAAAKTSGETALRAALDEADVSPSAVDLIVPHGVGTPASDRYEARLLHRVFGGGDWPSVTVLKPWIGHSLGASALMESALLLAAMDRGCIPPTREPEVPFERHPLPLVTEWRAQRIDVAVKLTCAFAGYYGATVFRRSADATA